MARGRTPKQGERYPGGKLKPYAETPPAMIKRAYGSNADHAEYLRKIGSPELGTPFGQAYLAGRYTNNQYNAGLSFIRLLADYRQLKGIPSPTPKSMNIGSAGGKSLAADPDERTIARITGSYSSCIAALDRINPRAEQILENVVSNGMATVGHEQYLLVRRALSTLATVFGLQREEAA